MTRPDEHAERIREALKQATAEHLRHHRLLPEWAATTEAALDALVARAEQAERDNATLREALELLRNGCEQANLLLERDRFKDDSEAKVVRAVLRAALAATGGEANDE